MSFLGIDQSLNATGVCVVSDDGTVQILRTVRHEVGGVSDIKLLNIRRSVISAISGVRFACLESYSYDSIHRAFDLGEVAGTVKVALLENSVQYLAVPPVTLKLFATGSTRASKEDMVQRAREEGVALVDNDDNQADALFLARIAQVYTLGGSRRRCELEALHGLRSPSKKKTPRRVRRLVKNAV